MAFAQSDLGRISGFIKDPSGATVANAKIAVQNNSGLRRQTTTNESGYYTVTNVPPGFYTLIAEAAGFERYRVRSVRLSPGVSDLSFRCGAKECVNKVSENKTAEQVDSKHLLD
jgi:hypothetical protein